MVFGHQRGFNKVSKRMDGSNPRENFREGSKISKNASKNGFVSKNGFKEYICFKEWIQRHGGSTHDSKNGFEDKILYLSCGSERLLKNVSLPA